jgi:anaerobic magnesium-protoporphyrin IX monomethyl ester cyclase
LQQSAAQQSAEHLALARAALDARWNALIASEQAHRTGQASPPVTATLSHA